MVGADTIVAVAQANLNKTYNSPNSEGGTGTTRVSPDSRGAPILPNRCGRKRAPASAA